MKILTTKQISPLIFLLITTVLFSCAEPDRGRDIPIQISKLSGEFVREVPMHEGEEDLNWLDKIIPDLGLQRLDSGVSDIQIRIWIFHSMAIKKQIVVLKRHTWGWCADLIDFTEGDDNAKHLNLKPRITRTRYDILPKCGWKSFLIKLNELGVFDFLQSGNVQNHPGCGGTDGMDYKFEFATSKTYRLQYQCVAVQTVEKLTELLEKEFDLTLLI